MKIVKSKISNDYVIVEDDYDDGIVWKNTDDNEKIPTVLLLGSVIMLLIIIL